MTPGHLARATAIATAYVGLAWASKGLTAVVGVIEPALWLPSGVTAAAVLLWGAAALPGTVLGALLVALLYAQPMDWLAVATAPAQAYVIAALYARFTGRGALARPGIHKPVSDCASAAIWLLCAAALGACLAPGAAAALRLACGDAGAVALSLGRIEWAAHLLGIGLVGAPAYHLADRKRGGTGLLNPLAPTGLVIASLGIPGYLVHELAEAGFFGPQLSLLVQDSVSVGLFVTLNTAGLLALSAGSYLGLIRRRHRRERLVTENAHDYVTLYEITAKRTRLSFSSPSYRRLVASARWGSELRIHADDFARVRESFQSTAATGQPARYEFRIVDGTASTIRWIETEASVAPEPSQNVKYVLCVSRDVTDRKRVEHQLRDSDDHLREIYGNAPVAIALLQDRRLCFPNPEATRLLGRMLPDEVERVFFALIPSSGKEQTGPGPWHTDVETSLASRPAWLDIVWKDILWTGRRATIVFFRDVTEHKHAERQVRELARMDMIGQLTGGLAHDFNNLLGVVVGNLDLLHERLPANPAAQRQHRAALDAALRGADVSRRLLGVASREPLEVKVHDLNAVLAAMEPLLRTSTGAAISLSMELCENVLDVPLDASGISNAVLNLVLNARDAMHESHRERRIAVRTRREIAWAVLEVSDNGIGMSEAVRARAFDPFFTTKRSGKGTGLGLAMVRIVTAQLGGDVAIDSAIGEGTTVALRLPLASGARAPEPPGEVARDHGKRVDRTLRVLVVDDEADLRELACTWLAALGHVPVNAPSPAEALERLGEGFDLLFTEIVMPGPMDGIALANEALARQPGLRVLLTSGHARILVESSRPLPGPLLRKPYRLNDITQALAAIQQAPAPPGGAGTPDPLSSGPRP